MANKKNTDAMDWSKAIMEMGKREREIDNMLSPNKGQLRSVMDYAKAILEKATRMDMASAIAHEKVITFEQGQQIMDWQKEQLLRDIQELQRYLTMNDKKQVPRTEDEHESN